MESLCEVTTTSHTASGHFQPVQDLHVSVIAAIAVTIRLQDCDDQPWATSFPLKVFGWLAKTVYPLFLVML